MKAKYFPTLAAVLMWLGMLLCTPGRAAEAASPPEAAAASPDRLQVTEPYLELHTGPGRGYPVSMVVLRHEWIDIELRHTDWFRVRTANGKVGWVVRQQLETTLTASGVRKSFRDVLLDDYLHRRAQLGAAWGRFDGQPALKVWSGYRMSETLSLEATLGQVQGLFSATEYWHVDLLTEPWSDQKWSPFAGIGVGRYTDTPNATLVGATTTHAKLAHAVVGLNYYLSDRFIVRADYGLHTVYLSDTLTHEYRAWSLGVAFFF
jgi:uncharacterized protein YgiM (DUF1202 family)